ncbi:dipeptidylpeptidase [Blyttiomyces sp. JEL0837]|nr:dipeptidylpeptidase [Blyttiomyces sp. JEL0837]
MAQRNPPSAMLSGSPGINPVPPLSWDAVRATVRSFHSTSPSYSSVTAKDFAFDSSNGRVFYLASIVIPHGDPQSLSPTDGSPPNGLMPNAPSVTPVSGKCTTIFMAQVKPDIGSGIIPSRKADSTNSQNHSGDDFERLRTHSEGEELFTPHFETTGIPVVTLDWITTHSGLSTPHLSSEDPQLKERKRTSTAGIQSFQFRALENGRCAILFSFENCIYYGCFGKDVTAFQPLQVSTGDMGSRFDAKLGGSKNDLIAFVRHRNLWVSTVDGFEMQLTSSPSPTISNGVAEYIMQEEFHRYSGFWWSPSKTEYGNILGGEIYGESMGGDGVEPTSMRQERILYLEVDESLVEVVTIARAGFDDKVDRYLYPRAGKSNAISEPCIVFFSTGDEALLPYSVVRKLHGRLSIRYLFPWAEYIVRVGWIPGGESVWMQLLDRLQQHLALIQVPVSLFMTEEEYSSVEMFKESWDALPPIRILCEEYSPIWINITDTVHFLRGNDDGATEFIWASERTGFRHLYHFIVEEDLPGIHGEVSRPQQHIYQITSGPWQVVDSPIWVDMATRLVFFMGKLDTPLESHLYVASFVPDVVAKVDSSRWSSLEELKSDEILPMSNVPMRLTKPGYSHYVKMDEACTMLVSTYSSVWSRPLSELFSLKHVYTTSAAIINPERKPGASMSQQVSQSQSHSQSQTQRHSHSTHHSNINSASAQTNPISVSTSSATTTSTTSVIDEEPDPRKGRMFFARPFHKSLQLPQLRSPQRNKSPSSMSASINSSSSTSRNAFQAFMHPSHSRHGGHRGPAGHQKIQQALNKIRQDPFFTGHHHDHHHHHHHHHHHQHSNGHGHSHSHQNQIGGSDTNGGSVSTGLIADVVSESGQVNGNSLDLARDEAGDVMEYIADGDDDEASMMQRDASPERAGSEIGRRVLMIDSAIMIKSRVETAVEARGLEELPVPEVFSFRNRDGIVIYGMIYRPENFQPGYKYPVLLRVYGGPNVQVVTNDFKYPKFMRIFLALKFGYVVVLVDSRGSYDRGLVFEGYIKHRLGTVEMEDQIEALVYLALRDRNRDQNMDINGDYINNNNINVLDGTPILPGETVVTAWNRVRQEFQSGNLQNTFIDPENISITGWSYGGYLSLMAIGKYPDIFKVSISGAPVTCWELYDTAYTERYMGLPEMNPEGYKQGRVLEYVDRFPDDCEKRVLIVHGSIDENVHFKNTEMLVAELIRAGKPHRVQVYPGERHGLRAPNVVEHFETLMIWTLLNSGSGGGVGGSAGAGAGAGSHGGRFSDAP